jgi:hypothetical protein
MNRLLLNKKYRFLVVLLCLNLFGSISQTFGQSNNNPNIPAWINEQPPEDMIWGIGLAKLVNGRNSMNLAELRARTSIVRQIYTPITILVRDDDNEFNNLYFLLLEYVAVQVSFELMNDTRVLKRWEAPDGNSWCLIEISKSDVRKYISVYESVYDQYYYEFVESTQ